MDRWKQGGGVGRAQLNLGVVDDSAQKTNRTIVRGREGANLLKESSRSRPSTTKADYSRAETLNRRLVQGAFDVQANKSRLDYDLTKILQAGRLAIHVDPPFTELEDEFSRLKTLCIQLATQTLHLRNQIQTEQAKQAEQKDRRPSDIKILPLPQPDFSGSQEIENNRVKASQDLKTSDLAKSPCLTSPPPIPNPWPGRLSSCAAVSPDSHSRSPDSAPCAYIQSDAQMAFVSSTQPTPTLDRLLDALQDAIQNRDGGRIAHDLQIEPPFGQAHIDLSREIQAQFPRGGDRQLKSKCRRVLPKSSEPSKYGWESFVTHLLEYLHFLRDYSSSDNLIKTSHDTKRLLNTAVTCLSDTNFGVLILPNVISLGKVLARILLGLDKRPQLLAQLWREYAVDQNRGIQEKTTFVEDTANTLREAFIKCLSDRSGAVGAGRHVAPHGKRVGIYKIGNLYLKLLFQCGKVSSATTMFVSIDTQSPLLLHYPASQRVTYLYYLGRYLFANNHFYRAQLALQAAYDQCHAHVLSNRRLILVYLIASNICLGRFPSSKLLLRTEAAALAKHYLPLCRLISSGNLSGFHNFLGLDNLHGQWFLRKRLLFQLRNRCELLVWRSLARRVFIEAGYPGGEDNKTPFLRLPLLQAVAQSLNRYGTRLISQTRPELLHTSFSQSTWNTHAPDDTDVEKGLSEDLDPEFAEMEEAIVETGFDIETGAYHELDADNLKGRGKINGVNEDSGSQVEAHPTIEEVESIMASLIQQDLISGFLTHSNPRFAIPGAKTKGALAVGFPSIWGVIEARKHTKDVPGWVKQDERHDDIAFEGEGGLAGGGRVVNLSGARPVVTGAL